MSWQATLAARVAALAPRERALLAAAAALTLAIVGWIGLAGISADLAALRARVAGRERELAAVRRLAGQLREGPAPAAVEPPDAPSLLTRLESAAAEVVGRERIAAMTPTTGSVDDGTAEERVALRVSGASLAEVVRLLHGLESGAGLAVATVGLRKHPDDPARFEVTVEVARLVPAEAAP